MYFHYGLEPVRSCKGNCVGAAARNINELGTRVFSPQCAASSTSVCRHHDVCRHHMNEHVGGKQASSLGSSTAPRQRHPGVWRSPETCQVSANANSGLPAVLACSSTTKTRCVSRSVVSGTAHVAYRAPCALGYRASMSLSARQPSLRLKRLQLLSANESENLATKKQQTNTKSLNKDCGYMSARQA